MRRRYSRGQLQTVVFEILYRHRNQSDWDRRVPIPIEEIAETCLGLTVEMYDLQGAYGPGILGMLIRRKRLIRIDESLDPVAHPENLGRYRFTLAHEVAHWLLHTTADGPDWPAASSRTGRHSSKSAQEWEADAFAAAILMPIGRVVAAWEAVHKVPSAEVKERMQTDDLLREGYLCSVEQEVREIARQFEVSVEAMRIRLNELELLPS